MLIQCFGSKLLFIRTATLYINVVNVVDSKVLLWTVSDGQWCPRFFVLEIHSYTRIRR